MGRWSAVPILARVAVGAGRHEVEIRTDGDASLRERTLTVLAANENPPARRRSSRRE